MVADGYLTYEEVLDRLKTRAQALGSQARLAQEAGVSYQLLNDVIHRRSKRLGPKLLAGLGLREVVLYAPLVQQSAPLSSSAGPAAIAAPDSEAGAPIAASPEPLGALDSAAALARRGDLPPAVGGD